VLETRWICVIKRVSVQVFEPVGQFLEGVFFKFEKGKKVQLNIICHPLLFYKSILTIPLSLSINH